MVKHTTRPSSRLFATRSVRRAGHAVMPVEPFRSGARGFVAAASPHRASRAGELERLADRVLADREVVALPHGPVSAGLTEPRFTTRELPALEQDLIEHATRPKRGDRAQLPIDAVRAACGSRGLSDEHAAVVTDLCWGGEHVSVVRAAAGTGKTFVLDAAREAWQSQQIEVLGCALSARAALELSDHAVIPSGTIVQLTGRLVGGGRRPAVARERLVELARPQVEARPRCSRAPDGAPVRPAHLRARHRGVGRPHGDQSRTRDQGRPRAGRWTRVEPRCLRGRRLITPSPRIVSVHRNECGG